MLNVLILYYQFNLLYSFSKFVHNPPYNFHSRTTIFSNFIDYILFSHTIFNKFDILIAQTTAIILNLTHTISTHNIETHTIEYTQRNIANIHIYLILQSKKNEKKRKTYQHPVTNPQNYYTQLFIFCFKIHSKSAKKSAFFIFHPHLPHNNIPYTLMYSQPIKISKYQNTDRNKITY